MKHNLTPLPPLKCIFFDLGNVVIFFSQKKMIRQLAQIAGTSQDEMRSILLSTPWLKQYEIGKISTQQLYQFFLQRAKTHFSLEQMIEAACEIFTPNQEIYPLIKRLKEKKIRLILLSNTSECHYQKISRDYPTLLGLFEKKILSYEVGFAKPQKQIFELALKEAQCPPEECLYIDDIQEFVDSARHLGLPAEVYQDLSTLALQIHQRGLWI